MNICFFLCVFTVASLPHREKQGKETTVTVAPQDPNPIGGGSTIVVVESQELDSKSSPSMKGEYQVVELAQRV